MIPNQTGAIIFLIIIIIVGIIIYYYDSKLKRLISEKRLEAEQQGRQIADLQLNVNVLAKQEFEKFKEKELAEHLNTMKQAAVKLAEGLLAEWRVVEEKRIREDAIKRSMSVNLGKITEHLIPYSAYFSQFNPKDARFIGAPIDLIVFDGISDDKAEISIHFVEIKTGTAGLNKVQKKIKSAIESKNIFWYQINMLDFAWQENETPALQIESSDKTPS